MSLIGALDAYSTGAPGSAEVCQSMFPGHGVDAQTTQPPFVIQLSKKTFSEGGDKIGGTNLFNALCLYAYARHSHLKYPKVSHRTIKDLKQVITVLQFVEVSSRIYNQKFHLTATHQSSCDMLADQLHGSIGSSLLNIKSCVA